MGRAKGGSSADRSESVPGSVRRMQQGNRGGRRALVTESLVSGPTGGAPHGSVAAPRAKVLYGVIRTSSPTRFGAVALGGPLTDVVTVNHRDLAAVVSDSDGDAIQPTRENVLAHEEVSELVLRRHSFVPAAFGTIVPSSSHVVEMLRGAYDTLTTVLDQLDSKVEYSVKVLWDRTVVARDVEAGDGRLRRIQSALEALSSRAAYFQRIRYGKLLRTRVEARAADYARDLLESLRPAAVACRVNRPLGDRVILNAAFLVSRDHETDFVRRVRETGARLDELTIRYGGPFPAYNFVTLPLELVEAR